MPDAVAVPAHLLPGRTPRELLALAHAGVRYAKDTPTPGMRYATAHLAALRAAAAILAARAQPTRSQRGPVPSVWVLLAQVAPELAQWAAHFANTSATRAAAEAGIPHIVTDRDADDMVQAAEQFLALAEDSIGGTRHA